jgi:hypothetical protein
MCLEDMLFRFTNGTVRVFIITRMQEAYIFKHILKVVCDLKTNGHWYNFGKLRPYERRIVAVSVNSKRSVV